MSPSQTLIRNKTSAKFHSIENRSILLFYDNSAIQDLSAMRGPSLLVIIEITINEVYHFPIF